jgi:hypothetical protein|tara:strand:- start:368 stop:712 length:345 start_codon:yes stop_codon:yes gene_type:complete
MAALLGIQILGGFFGAFMAYYTFLHYKRKEITLKEYSFWIVLWFTFLAVTIMPRLLDPVVKTLNLARTMDFFIILGFMFLIGTIFYTYLLVRKNQKRLENIVRKVAMDKPNKKQ